MPARLSSLGAGAATAVSAELSAEDRMLILLRDELYEGRWDLMRQDLLDRLSGRPYIYKLVHRIQDDLGRIDRLKRGDAASVDGA